MTYKQHEAAVYNAAKALRDAIQASRDGNFDIQFSILRESFGPRRHYYVYMSKVGILDPAKVGDPAVTLHRKKQHEEAVRKAAEALAHAFTSAAKAHYVFHALVVGTKCVEVEDRASDFSYYYC